MPRPLLALVATALAACGSGRTGDVAPVEVRGLVYSGFCDTHPGATIEVLDAAEVRTTAGSDGRFTLAQVPPRSALLATAPEHVPTLTSVRAFGAAGAEQQLALVPRAYSELFHLLADSELRNDAGTVVLAVLDQTPLPIAGAEVALVGAQVERRYLALSNGLPLFTSEGGTQDSGLSVFLEVPPGRYTARVVREGYTFADVPLEVRAGTITVELVHGAGSGGAVPTRVSGVVRGSVFPSVGVAAPLAGATVTITTEDGLYEAVTTTDAAGGYTFELPFMRRTADLTVTADGLYPERGPIACFGVLSTGNNLTLSHRFELERELGRAFATEPAQSNTGVIYVATLTADDAPITGATLGLEPAAREPTYYRDFRMSCALASCAGGETCPAGSRCQAGECVSGAEGDLLCSACTGASCPTGYRPWGMPRFAGGDGCYCMPDPPSCDLASPTCVEGTFCWTPTTVDTFTNTWVTSESACYLQAPSAPATSVFPGTQQLTPTFFLNLAPGLYTLTGLAPDSPLAPRRVRVSAGVLTSTALRPSDVP